MSCTEAVRRCVECGGAVDPLEEPHAAHERDCHVTVESEDWYCGCDAVAHVRCCRACGFEVVAMTAVRAASKRRTG